MGLWAAQAGAWQDRPQGPGRGGDTRLSLPSPLQVPTCIPRIFSPSQADSHPLASHVQAAAATISPGTCLLQFPLVISLLLTMHSLTNLTWIKTGSLARSLVLLQLICSSLLFPN